MAIFIYPAQSVVASNPSVGVNGNPAPPSSTQVAGTDGTNLVPLSVNSAGALALPQGASTEAKQDVGNTSLANIDGKVATETTLQTLATEATVSTLATEATVSTLATEATVSTLATEATVSTLATEATVSTLATAAAQTDGSQKTQIVDGAGNVIGSTSNALNVNIAGSVSPTLIGKVDTNNSTTATLGISGVFTGTATDIKDYGTVSVLVASDVAAASGGLSLQFSNDGTNWDHAHNFDFAGGNLSYNISAEARYFRIVYTNGVVAQSYFRLQTVLRPVNVMPSQYTVAQPVSDGNLSTVTKGVIYGKTTGMGGGYVAVKVNPSGALTVESTVTSSALPAGAATETTLQSVDSNTSTLASTVVAGRVGVDVLQSVLPSGAATELSLTTLSAKVPSNLTVSSNRLLVDGSGVTQPISAASLPLPTGAATETTLSALNQRLGGSLTPVRFDEIALTYVSSGNGAGEIQTAVFKLASATVRTLTLSYDSSNRLTGVVAT